jgi:hypothetical protein
LKLDDFLAERKPDSGVRKAESGKRKAESGKWKAESGVCAMRKVLARRRLHSSRKRRFPTSAFILKYFS